MKTKIGQAIRIGALPCTVNRGREWFRTEFSLLRLTLRSARGTGKHWPGSETKPKRTKATNRRNRCRVGRRTRRYSLIPERVGALWTVASCLNRTVPNRGAWNRSTPIVFPTLDRFGPPSKPSVLYTLTQSLELFVFPLERFHP